MNYKITFKKIFLIAITGFLGSQSMAQLANTGDFTRAGDDASAITKAYIGPLFKGFGVGLNNGWFNTANVHKSGRFDLTFAFSAVFVPDADKTYDASTLNLQIAEPTDKANTIAPTIFRENTDQKDFYSVYYKDPITHNKVLADKFNAPGGIGFGLVPVPIANLSVGVIKGTEVSIRYIPTISNNKVGAKISLIGFGVKHSIKQWIPGISELPFDLSAQAAYTTLTASTSLDVDHNDPTKEMVLKTHAYTFNVIVSKQIAMLTGYAAVGYQGSSSDININGTYKIQGPSGEMSITNPVSVTASGANGLRATLGARLKLLVATLHADYTFSSYSSATIGLGVCVDFL